MPRSRDYSQLTSRVAWSRVIGALEKVPKQSIIIIMSDDKTKRGPQDRERINVREDYELRDWAKKLGVTPDELKQAVKKVGPMVDDVKKEFKK
jgi:hypothetical protein